MWCAEISDFRPGYVHLLDVARAVRPLKGCIVRQDGSYGGEQPDRQMN